MGPTVYSERQIFEKLFHGRFILLWEKSAERSSPKKYFSYFFFNDWPGIRTQAIATKKPTHYLLDHGDYYRQCIQIIKTYYRNGDSATPTYRALRGDIGLYNHRFALSAENIAIVGESVAEDPNVSNPRRYQELGLSYGTLWRFCV